jgi:DNA helicase-2/ATP-dependent DNA helicase PcrA
MYSNILYLASAGSGKTTQIARETTSLTENVLIVTYTNENCSNIINKIEEIIGFVPANITILSWYNFIMRECCRPFQSCITEDRIINFCYDEPPRYATKDSLKYFLTKTSKLYSEHAVRFAIRCNELLPNCVIERLEKIYQYIYFDEIQDICGYDLDFIESLLKSKIQITMCGDIRQATFTTNNNLYNKKYKGFKIWDKFKEWEKQNLLKIEYQNYSYRCHQSICDIADLVFPEMNSTNSETNYSCNCGVYCCKEEDLEYCLATYKPVVLHNTKRDMISNSNNLTHYNFGESKGLTVDNVLIVCTKPFADFVKDKILPESEESKSKLYVAITRARYNVIFYYKKGLKDSSFIEFIKKDEQ